MAKFWTKKARRNAKIIGFLCIVVIVWGAFTNWRFFSLGGAAGFAITPRDGKTGATLDTSLVSWTLTGRKASTDATDPATYITVATGTDLKDLTSVVVAAALGTYAFLYVTATCSANEERMWCAFGTSEMQLVTDATNDLMFYAAPTQKDILLYNQTFNVISITNFTNDATWGGNVAAWNDHYQVGNFSGLLGMNSSDLGYCGYHGYFDVATATSVDLYWVFDFNNTAILNVDLDVKGTSTFTRLSEKLNSTSIGFMADQFTVNTITNFDWKSTIDDVLIKCIRVNLFMGTKAAVAAGTATCIATCIA